MTHQTAEKTIAAGNCNAPGDAIAIGSRFDPLARGFDGGQLRRLAGPFLDEVWRVENISGSQRDLARFLCRCTLSAGRQRMVFDSLDVTGQFLKLSRARVHSLLFGEWLDNVADGAWVPGLAQNYAPRRGSRKMPNLRLFLFERFNAGAACPWLVTVIPDSGLWTNVAWRWPAGALSVAVGALLAKAEQFTPFVPALAPEADLNDANAIVAADAAAHSVTGHHSKSNDHETGLVSGVAPGITRSFVEYNAGARREFEEGTGALSQCGRSGKGNGGKGDFPRNSEGVPEKGTQLLTVKRKTTETVQRLNCYGSGDRVTGLLREIEAQFARAHGAAEARREMTNSGAAWRKRCERWPDVMERELGGLRDHIATGGTFKRKAWFYLGHYVLRALGCESWDQAWNQPRNEARKNSKESLTNP